MKKKVALALVALSFAMVSGCASILAGSTQQVSIGTSNNKTIKATVDGKQVTVPGIIEVNRKNQDLVITTSDGKCAPKTLMPKTIETTFWVNMISGGPIGSTVDYATESMWKYDENTVIQCGA